MGDRLGEQLGAHVIVARVADGAMGRVYEARHHETGDRVAVKVLHQEVARDNVAVQRFQREYETAQSLSHDCIVKVLDFGETEDGAHFMTMEYLEGEELSLVLERDGAMRPARAIRIFCQLALGLHHAHADGVIHRDLKPDNIFLCVSQDGDDVRILDFGSVKLQLAFGPKLTALGTTVGSPCYMSPEQAMGKLDVDQRTDVFAQAAIMYELATGQVAFAGDKVPEVLMKIVNEEPSPVSLYNDAYSTAFDEVIQRGLRKDKTSRFATTIELAEAALRAFGLEADVKLWARTAIAKLEEALEASFDPSAMESMVS